MSLSKDLNCDMGEYESLSASGNDAAIMPFISSCNVACGAHAGNRNVINQTIALALANGVQVGAHPSYPDRDNFGRQVLNMSRQELNAIFKKQIQAVYSSARSQQGRMLHVKPHGALYNQAAQDIKLSAMLLETVADLDADLQFYGLAHSATAVAAKQVGVEFVAEGFADRGYTAEKTLVARSQPGAVITSPHVILQRALRMVKGESVEAVSGEPILLNVQTLCLHGDHSNSLATAKNLCQGLNQAGYKIQAPRQILP